jgi:hypothetical protein
MARLLTANQFKVIDNSSLAMSYESDIPNSRSFMISPKHLPKRGTPFRSPISGTDRLEETLQNMREASEVPGDLEPTTITHRRFQAKLLEPPEESDSPSSTSKLGRAGAQLARLAYELAKAPNAKTLAKLALDGLFTSTQVDSGAVLLVPRDFQGDPNGQDLEVTASRSDGPHSYQRLSSFLATTVMREGEAVLARNVMGDSTLGTQR